MTKKIILIDDSEDVCKQVRDAIDDVFGDEVEIETLKFEKAAENFIAQTGREWNVVAIILDLMIDYDPNYETPVPERARLEGALSAGYRILERLSKQSNWRQVPVIIFSSTDEDTITQELRKQGYFNPIVIQKSDSLNPLLQKLAELTGFNKG